jgi:5-formyltetrahydrofolate cyclo-ligase
VTAQAGSISNSRAERRILRQRVRAERRALSAGVRAAADRSIVGHIRRLAAYRSARRIAIFLAFDGEPSLAALLESAARSGKQLYAPVITRARMRFAELELGGPLGTNFFGIEEPRLGAGVDPRRLDLVLTPLVAFDDRGVRIGVGRGYYDRCFRFLRARAGWQKPKLLAVAYELQHVPSIEENAWDVPLWGAVTEAGVRRFDRENPQQSSRS